MASKLIIPLYVDRVGKMLKRTGFSEYYSANTKINLKRGTSYRFHVYFLETNHTTFYSLDSGAVVRISMRKEGVFDENVGVLAVGESSSDPAETGDPYVIDITLNTQELDDYLGVNSTAGDDVVSANVEFGISWTEDGWETKQENNDRVLGFLVNDVNKQGDGTPIPLPTPSDWLSARAVRFDVVQSLTQPQKDRAMANLGMPTNNYLGTSAPTVSDDELDGYSVGSKWYDTVAKEVYLCVDATQGSASWELITLTADDLGSAAFLNATSDGDANPDEVLKTDADGGVTVTSLALRKLALITTDPVEPTSIGETAWSVDEEVPYTLLKDNVKLHHGNDVVYHVDNRSGNTIPKGTPVSYAGTVGSSGKLRIAPWDGTSPASSFMGFTMSDIGTEYTGFVQHFGAIRGIDTSGASSSESWVDGDILYAVQDSASLTKVKPAVGGYAIVAVVINAHASNGTLFVRPSVVPTPEEIGGVVDSDLSSYPQEGKVPVWVNAYKVVLSSYTMADGVYHREELDYNGRPQYVNVRSNNSWIRWSGSQWELYDNLGELAVVAFSNVDSPNVPTTGWVASDGSITVELFATTHGLGEAAFFDVDRSGASVENFKLIRASDPRLSDARTPLAHSHPLEPITVEVTGTLSGPLGPLVQCPPRTVSLLGTAYVNSGKWLSVISAIGSHPNALFNFPDLEGIEEITTLVAGDYPSLKFAVLTTLLPTFGYPTRAAIFPQLVACIAICTFGTTPVTSISCPELLYVRQPMFSNVNFSNCTTISLPKLVQCSSGIGSISSSPMLTTITLPPVGVWKDAGSSSSVNITGAALTQTTVNNLLEHLAYMDGTNGTRLFGSGSTINLSGGTSAAPSNLGSVSTAGSNFVCSGTTCTVNMTNHGYATGDVLRVSGVTTATNANRYAVITVVNANQFTYTITSQTATGGGTATVVRAGASARTLVTRGVTLTTN